MFKKNYFYSIEWYDDNNEKRISSGILSNVKKIKTNELKERINDGMK